MQELDYTLENIDLNKTPEPDGIHAQMISNFGKNSKEILLIFPITPEKLKQYLLFEKKKRNFTNLLMIKRATGLSTSQGCKKIQDSSKFDRAILLFIHEKKTLKQVQILRLDLNNPLGRNHSNEPKALRLIMYHQRQCTKDQDAGPEGKY
ncbi:hypothetical protein LAZ67_1007514 [Cordylochernes scorpioides]|uniref:Uncharacterized protein n=1 Tax=Cordylochernes scorpioides TaxID=51811 RepID=A0ABY6K0G2_9ARAC|nr:hypothetical protein LAZ67_1007514 [Cordylochernes scorpioides]